MANENIIIQREIKTRKTGMVFSIQKYRVKGRRTQEEWCKFYNGARVLFIRKFRPLHRSSGLCSPLERSKHKKMVRSASSPLERSMLTARAVNTQDGNTNFACLTHPCHFSSLILD